MQLALATHFSQYGRDRSNISSSSIKLLVLPISLLLFPYKYTHSLAHTFLSIIVFSRCRCLCWLCYFPSAITPLTLLALLLLLAAIAANETFCTESSKFSLFASITWLSSGSGDGCSTKQASSRRQNGRQTLTHRLEF